MRQTSVVALVVLTAVEHVGPIGIRLVEDLYVVEEVDEGSGEDGGIGPHVGIILMEERGERRRR